MQHYYSKDVGKQLTAILGDSATAFQQSGRAVRLGSETVHRGQIAPTIAPKYLSKQKDGGTEKKGIVS